MSDTELRQVALQAALAAMGGLYRPAEEIIQQAGLIEEYLRNGKPTRPNNDIKAKAVDGLKAKAA